MKRRIYILLLGFLIATGIHAQGDEPQPQILNIGNSKTINCTDDPVRIGVKILNWQPGFTYKWNTGETDSIIAVKPAKSSTYELQITNPQLGIKAYRAFEIRVENDPVRLKNQDITYGKTDCPPENLILTADVEGGYGPFTYTWSNGFSGDFIQVPAKSNVYEVTATDVCGQQANAVIRVDIAPHDPIVVNKTTVVPFKCEGEEIKVFPKITEISGGVGYGYVYTFSNWENANSAIEVKAEDGAVYIAQVTDACKTQSTSTEIVLEHNPPAPVQLKPMLVCEGEEVEFCLPEAGTRFYYWHEGELTTSHLEHIDQSKQIELTYLDECGDQQRTIRKIIVDEPLTDFDFQVYTISEKVHMWVSSPQDGYTYQWNISGREVASGPEAEIQTDGAESVDIQLTATNERGCSATKSEFVSIEKEAVLPTAFSPNGDGKNDYFELNTSEIFSYFLIEIFDRWGQLIYQSRDQHFRWDGREAQNGFVISVVYHITGVTVEGETVDRYGTLTIVN
ncbi:MAG: hypothetical protein Kow0075_00820 [Salibacteraceae bacterium]